MYTTVLGRGEYQTEWPNQLHYFQFFIIPLFYITEFKLPLICDTVSILEEVQDNKNIHNACGGNTTFLWDIAASCQADMMNVHHHMVTV